MARRFGFTIMELLIVLAIVGFLSVVALPQLVNYSEDAKDAQTRVRLKEIKEAITGDPRLVAGGTYVKPGFENDLSDLPVDLDDLTDQGAYADYDPYTKQGWRGPYVNLSDSNWKNDAWGTEIDYNSGIRRLTSCGPNKACGDGDDIVSDF